MQGVGEAWQGDEEGEFGFLTKEAGAFHFDSGKWCYERQLQVGQIPGEVCQFFQSGASESEYSSGR